MSWILGLIVSSAFATGGIVGNGGDLIYCKGPLFPADGYVSLDYALAIGKGFSKDDFRAEKPWSESAQEIAQYLVQSAPHLSASFQSFIEGQNRTWKDDWTAQLTHVVDEVFGNVQDLPQACWWNPEQPDLTGFVSFRTIWRVNQSPHVTYHYDPSRLASLMQNSPLQYSIIMIHEWLWDLTQDVEINRALSRDLHLINPPDSLQERLSRLQPAP